MSQTEENQKLRPQAENFVQAIMLSDIFSDITRDNESALREKFNIIYEYIISEHDINNDSLSSICSKIINSEQLLEFGINNSRKLLTSYNDYLSSLEKEASKVEITESSGVESHIEFLFENETESAVHFSSSNGVLGIAWQSFSSSESSQGNFASGPLEMVFNAEKGFSQIVENLSLLFKRREDAQDFITDLKSKGILKSDALFIPHFEEIEEGVVYKVEKIEVLEGRDILDLLEGIIHTDALDEIRKKARDIRQELGGNLLGFGGGK